MTQNTEHAVAEFVERLGLVAQADGLPRIAGRIMGFLVIHGGPFSFAELAEQLQVSRGSISTNTRLLENLGVIERVTRPGDRQDYFQIRARPYVELMRGVQGRLKKANQAVSDAQSKLPDDWSDAQARLADLGAFYSSLIDRTATMIDSGEDN
jgi:DNA-binding transcriptional regulator GbsR (MarR family)